MDCLEGLKNMDEKSVDLVIMDPPYNIKGIHQYDKNKLGKQVFKYQKELEENQMVSGFDLAILDELMKVMKAPNIYIWCNIVQVPMYIKYFCLEHQCKMDILIWNKTNPPPLFHNKYMGDKEYCLYFRKGGYCQPSCYADAKTIFTQPLNVKDKKLYHHPTIKPLDIIETLVRNSSREGDVVLDCFLGSGTSAVAALNEKRQYIGFEIDENYYATSLERLELAKSKIL
jgi:site-specific DNA-methyltransferase (adenine-specific)